jgi:hypothetical protein
VQFGYPGAWNEAEEDGIVEVCCCAPRRGENPVRIYIISEDIAESGRSLPQEDFVNMVWMEVVADPGHYRLVLVELV